MLVRSLKVSPSLLLLLVLCAFLGWRFISQPPLPEGAPPPPRPHPRTLPPADQKLVPSSVKNVPRVALVTLVTNERSYVQTSLQNKDHYARRHGLDLIVDYEAHSKLSTVWWKFDMMERLIRQDKWDWIWWLDFDTLITNTDIKVTDIITETLKNATNPDQIDYLLTHDCNGLNLGSFMVRSHNRSLKFLHDMFAIEANAKKKDKNAQMSEQDAFTQLLKDPASKKRTVVVPQRMLNAFPEEIPCYEDEQGEWQPGYFLVHFAGAWAHVEGDDPTGQLMRKYKDEIIWGDWKDFY